MWSLILSSVCGLGSLTAGRPAPAPVLVVRQESTADPAAQGELLSAQEVLAPASAVPS
jgi:hypothetical protein